MAATKEATAPVKVTEPVFTKKDLIESAAVFNTTPAIMTGALYGIKKEQLTREEATKAVADFLNKPVKKGDK